MAGSRKWFVYTTDSGSDFAIQLDESNTEAVNGATQDLVEGINITFALPRNVKPRCVYYSNTNNTRTIKCVALTQTIYNGLVAGNVASIPDPINPEGPDLILKRTLGEKVSRPYANDTGIIDGDAT